MQHTLFTASGQPFRLSGVVVGALLNDTAQWAALGASVHEPPYKAPPRGPVLEIKPRHTLAADGATVEIPAGHHQLEAGASVGVLIGRAAHRVRLEDALQHVQGYLLAGDFSLPLSSHYRPSVHLKARDGYAPLGIHLALAADVADPDALAVSVAVDGQVVHSTEGTRRVRGVAELIADVTEFMTLHAGDVLLLGRSHGTPTVRPGQQVNFSAPGLGTLTVRIVQEAPSEVLV